MDVLKAFEDFRTETEKKMADEVSADAEKVKAAKTAVEDEIPDESGNTDVDATSESEEN